MRDDSSQKKWKKLSQKLLFTHPRLSVYEDDVELPSGHKTSYIHFGETHNTATVVAIDDQGRLLVQKEYSYPSDTWLYQFPGGAIEKGETPEQGAMRELAEEAQLTGTLEFLSWHYSDHRRKASRFYIFVARDLSEKIEASDIEEEFESYWFTPAEIEEMIARDDIINSSFLATWATYKAKLKAE